ARLVERHSDGLAELNRLLEIRTGAGMRARVFVTLKPSVFDPQGRTIAEALHSLGYGAVDHVRQGKYFELDLNTLEAGEAKALRAEVADKLLANPVIESYRVEVDS